MRVALTMFVLLAVVAVPALSLPAFGEDAASFGRAERVQEFGCVQDIGFFPLPVASLQALLPPGFQAAAVDPLGTMGAVFVASLACARTVVDGAEGGPAMETGTGILVGAPEGWAAPGVGTYVVATFANTAPAVAGAFADWGIGGSGMLDVQSFDGPGTSLGLARGSYAGRAFTLAAATTGEERAAPASHIRAFGVRDGAIAGVVDLVNEPSTARGGAPGGAALPGSAAFTFDPSPYGVPAATGFAQHARWPGLALQWDVVAAS